MRISLALGPRKTLDRQTAWGCLTSNLAVPGVGSLIAGRVSGYAQLVFGLVGLGMTTAFGLRFILWYLNEGSKSDEVMGDGPASLREIWIQVRLAFAGILVFATAWFWGLATAIGIVLASNPTPPRQV